MARMPDVEWLGEHSPKRRMARYDIVCVHTIVGYAPAHAAHFSVHQGGTIQQSRDTRYRSAANLDGNHRVIAIENEDHGSAFPSWSGSNVPPLTDAQVEADAQILAWAHETHGVPLQLCPDSRPGSRGLAYHRQGIDGNFGPFKYGGRVSRGENWSTSFGKVCPGDQRIDQLPAILARAKQIIGGDDMATAKDIATAVWRLDGIVDRPASKTTGGTHWRAMSVIRNTFDLINGKVAPNGWMKRRWSIPDNGYSPRVYWRATYGHARAAKEEAAANGKQLGTLAGEVAGLRNAVEQLAGNTGQPIDMAAVQAAALSGAQAAMAELSITVQVEPAQEPDGDEPDPAEDTDA